jgi:hypothetical protein
MIRQCFLLQTGILFHADMLRLVGMDPDTLYPRVLARPPPLLKSPQETQSSSTVKTMGLLGECDFRSEEEEDLVDALSPINDELRRAKLWWILEIMPQKLRFQEDDDSWTQKLEYDCASSSPIFIALICFHSVHRGRGRHIPRQSTHGVKIHRTVKMRMEAMGYKPNANLKPTTEPTWVD